MADQSSRGPCRSGEKNGQRGRVEVGGRVTENERLRAQGDGAGSVVGGGFKTQRAVTLTLPHPSSSFLLLREDAEISEGLWSV